MAHAIFELDTIKNLPLWAQVLLASRLCRRAALWLPVDTPASTRDLLTDACDAIDRCALIGQRPATEIGTIQKATDHQPTSETEAAFAAIYYAADAAMAAEASLDFEAAEAACTNSVLKAMACVSEQHTLSPLQTRIFAAADLDTLRFACKENSVGRYDALGSAVFGRLAPVAAPNPGDIRPRPTNDPQADFR